MEGDGALGPLLEKSLLSTSHGIYVREKQPSLHAWVMTFTFVYFRLLQPLESP